MKKWYLKILCFLILTLPIIGKAKNYDYVINNYDVDIVVNENNSFNITETIDVYFNKQKHGIYRNIPTKNVITRLDGTTSTNRPKIRNVSVNDKYSTSWVSTNGNSYKKLKIGDANKTITGFKRYVIQYLYDIGKDPLEDKDELYFNIIGSGWEDTEISDIDFKITLPKEFDKEKVGFSVGQVGSTTSDNIVYNVDDKTITGHYYGTITKGEALTVRLELPEGYFVNAGFHPGIAEYIMIIIPILFVLVAFILWIKYGKDKKYVDTIEFYPPQNLNSLELAFLEKGYVENKDITSLIIYLANKGYIKIQEIEAQSLFGKEKTFSLIKLKDYDGTNIYESDFMNGLFKTSNTATPISLSNSFYKTMNSIKNKIESKRNKNTIYEKSSLKKKIIIISMIIITFVLMILKPVIEYEPIMLSFVLIFWGIAFPVVGLLIKSKNLFSVIFAIVWGTPFIGVPIFIVIIPTIIETPFYIVTYIIGLISIIILAVFNKIMIKRTEYGVEILGKIKGFKKFLETAEKKKLEELVEDNPSYFFDILPYTYVLRVSNKWIKKFEEISYQAPDWYDSSGSFDMSDFGSFMNDTMSSANDSMSSSPSSSSDGGSSGGGSSDGGSGGGGGGSW